MRSTNYIQTIESGFKWERTFFGCQDILTYQDCPYPIIRPNSRNYTEYRHTLYDSIEQTRRWGYEHDWNPLYPPYGSGAACILSAIKDNRTIPPKLVDSLQIVPTTGTPSDLLGVDGVITDFDNTSWAQFDLKAGLPRPVINTQEVRRFHTSTPILIYERDFREKHKMYAQQLVFQILSKIQRTPRRFRTFQ